MKWLGATMKPKHNYCMCRTIHAKHLEKNDTHSHPLHTLRWGPSVLIALYSDGITLPTLQLFCVAWAISIANLLTQQKLEEQQMQENEEVRHNDGSTINSIVWYNWWRAAKMPREGLGWFDPAREPMKESRRVDTTLTPCRRRITAHVKYYLLR